MKLLRPGQESFEELRRHLYREAVFAYNGIRRALTTGLDLTGLALDAIDDENLRIWPAKSLFTDTGSEEPTASSIDMDDPTRYLDLRFYDRCRGAAGSFLFLTGLGDDPPRLLDEFAHPGTTLMFDKTVTAINDTFFRKSEV